jgi:predicted amidohydrolase YtcJ
MTAVFGEAHRLGWQMSCHVTGDEGVERVLDALEALDSPSDPAAAHRFNLIHAYFPTPHIVARSKRLGVGVDTQSYIYFKDSDWMADVYGKPWADMLIGPGAWFQGGVPVALNSDHMAGLDPDKAMNAYNPFLMLSIAVTRKNEQGDVHGQVQKLSRLDALRCVTWNGAWLAFDEDVKGSLEPGKLADLVVLDRDYLACPENEIRAIKPLMTMVDGKIVYQK